MSDEAITPMPSEDSHLFDEPKSLIDSIFTSLLSETLCLWEDTIIYGEMEYVEEYVNREGEHPDLHNEFPFVTQKANEGIYYFCNAMLYLRNLFIKIDSWLDFGLELGQIPELKYKAYKEHYAYEAWKDVYDRFEEVITK